MTFHNVVNLVNNFHFSKTNFCFLCYGEIIITRNTENTRKIFKALYCNYSISTFSVSVHTFISPAHTYTLRFLLPVLTLISHLITNLIKVIRERLSIVTKQHSPPQYIVYKNNNAFTFKVSFIHSTTLVDYRFSFTFFIFKVSPTTKKNQKTFSHT